MGILENFPFDLLVLDEDFNIRYVAFKNNRGLESVFALNKNYNEIFSNAKNLKKDLDNLVQNHTPFTLNQNLSGETYTLTHFYLAKVKAEKCYFGVFVRPLIHDINFPSFSELHELFYNFYKIFIYENESYEGVDKVLDQNNDPFLGPIVNKLKSSQYNPEKLFRYIFNYLGIFYYLDSLKVSVEERKKFFTSIKNNGVSEASETFMAMDLLLYLKNHNLELKDVFERVGKAFEAQALEEIVHYFCEISEFDPISINLNKNDELFSFLKDPKQDMERKYPFFFHRISTLEQDVFASKILSKLKFWDHINKLFWKIVSIH